jgi:hypothetical protein
MTALQRFVTSINTASRSRIGWLFVSIHTAWFFLAIANMSPPDPAFGAFFDNGGGSSATLVAGRPFHFVYESWWLQLLLMGDLPSNILIMPLSIPVGLIALLLGVGHYYVSYLGAAFWFLAGSIQWLIVGYRLDLRCEKSPFLSEVAGKFKSYALHVIVLVLIGTALTVAALNARSRHLGFRHSAISFGP